MLALNREEALGLNQTRKPYVRRRLRGRRHVQTCQARPPPFGGSSAETDQKFPAESTARLWLKKTGWPKDLVCRLLWICRRGPAEADEAYLGGSETNRCQPDRKGMRGTAEDKAVVIGAGNRASGHLAAKVVPNQGVRHVRRTSSRTSPIPITSS